MKKLLVTGAFLLSLASVYAQKEFTLEWKTEFPVNTEWRLINEDRTMTLGGDLAEIAMMDATTGKLIWKMNFKEKTGQKKAKDWNWDKDAKTVWVDVKGEKKDEVITYYFNEATGENISKEAYETRKTKKEKSRYSLKGSMNVEEHNSVVWLEYEKKKIVKSTGKGRKAELVVHASGNYSWSTSIQGNYIRTLCANGIPEAAAAFGGDFLKLMYTHDKVFVIYEGLSVLDIKTGKLLWQADFDNAEFDFGVFKSTQTLGRAGYPLADETGVYVADLSKGQYRIKKYNIETGALLWQGEPFDKDDVVPDLQVCDNVLVAQFGGRLEVQSYIPGVEGRPDVCKSEFKFAGNAGVKAYDVNTGKLLWETSAMKELGDKFSGAITNIITTQHTIYVASDKKIYAFDASGKAKYAIVAKDLKIGKPISVFMHDKNTLIVKAEEGIASINCADGKVNFASNTNKALGVFYEGDAFFVWTGKEPGDYNEFVRLDLSNGTIMGKIKGTSNPLFTTDGNHFIKFDGARIMRYKTN